MSIAFCFLLKDEIEHESVWLDFFRGAEKSKYNIYAHPKFTDKLPEWISKNVIEDTVETSWCGENLISACVNMFKVALKNKKNKYFVLVSGSCIPLYNFEDMYNIIDNEKKSRINSIDMQKNKVDYKYADQWILLNKYSAKLFIEIENSFDLLRDIYENKLNSVHCPDEIYPILYFMYKLDDKKLEKNINLKNLTYTKWKVGQSSPVILDSKKIKKDVLCKSGALLARKFTKAAAIKFGLSCSDLERPISSTRRKTRSTRRKSTRRRSTRRRSTRRRSTRRRSTRS